MMRRASGLKLVLAVTTIVCCGTWVAALYPPVGANWTRVQHNPVLSPTEPWEGNCLCENVAMLGLDGSYRMYYRGGWGQEAVGVAFSSDGVTWQKYAGNPIFGHGGSNVSGLNQGGQPWVIRDDSGEGYILYTSGLTASKTPKVNVATSTDGLLWSTRSDSHVPLPDGGVHWGNRVVWSARTEKKYTMLQEVMVAGVWKVFLYTSNNAYVWNLENGGEAVEGLEVVDGGCVGGPRVANVDGELTPVFPDGLYHLWYHASSEKGNLPTDIYHATSKDLVHWQRSPKTPVLTHTGGSTFEHDQVAGGVPLVTGKQAYMFYDGDNNVVGSCRIGAAVAPADTRHQHSVDRK